MSWYATKKASKLPYMDKSKILVFDVETTGLSPTLDEIIQITILDGYGSELFSSYIKPTRHKIWIEAQRINGIRYEMVKDAPTFRKVKKEIQEIFNNAELIVGYNVDFDIEFIEAAGVVVTGTRFDVMTAFASYRAGIEHSFYRKSRLTECAEYFGYSFNPHDAEEDARATLYCFDSMIEDARFTTYKRKEKKQLKEEIPEEKRDTGFTITVKGGQRRSILFGILLAVIGIAGLSKISGIIPDNMEAIKELFSFLKNHITSDFKTGVFAIMLALGCLMVIPRILRFIILLPKRILVYIKRLLSRF